MRDPYLYPDREVLRNLLGIMDSKRLQEAESDYVTLRLSEIAEDGRMIGLYDFAVLCRIHYRIFQDIYEWAGKIRIINIEKAEDALNGISVEYSDVFDIKKDAESALKKMRTFRWQDASMDEAAERFSDYMAELWKAHPFRDDGVIIGTRLEKPSKINGFALLSPIFLSHAGWREDGAVHINTYYTESQMGLCA